jgi:hypothetical protein
MRRIELTITFTDESGEERHESRVIETSYNPNLADEHRVAHILFAELKVTVGEQATPKHNATAWEWLEFPNRPAGIEQYFDIQNSQNLWRELLHLVAGAEGDLILAAMFKALESPQEPPFADGVAIMISPMCTTGK